MKSKPKVIESIALRRATIADTDKVRYRVYSGPTEFIAVIAESALMAVKVSGVRKPHKIVRDMPTEGIAVEAKKMAAMDAGAARVPLPVAQIAKPQQLVADLSDHVDIPKESLFRPMNLGDLRRSGIGRARILPPEMLSEIIEKHTKTTLPPVPESEPPAPEVLQEVPPPVPPSAEAPSASPQERLLEMADAMLPEAALPADAAPERVLTPEEVEKLLNG